MKRAITILITITIVVSVALFAWKLIGRDSSTSTAPNDATQNTSAPTDTTPDPTENGKYLVINEWGIKFGTDDIRGGQMTYLIDDRDSIPEDQRNKFIAFFDKSAAPYIAQLSQQDLQRAKECVSYAKQAGLFRKTTDQQRQAEADEYYIPAPIYTELNNYVYLANISNALCPVLYEANIDPALKSVFEKYYPFPQSEGIAAFARSARPTY